MLTPVKTAPLLTVHNPVGYPPKISHKQPAPRLSSLDGKTIYLVDSRFDDSIELLKQVQIWFAEKMPGVKTELRSMASYYGKDDPELAARHIKFLVLSGRVPDELKPLIAPPERLAHKPFLVVHGVRDEFLINHADGTEISEKDRAFLSDLFNQKLTF
mgnify:CR=1 FL=1